MDRLNHELEERVKERTAGLERSNRDLQQFAFVASHDLQEPLRMVVELPGTPVEKPARASSTPRRKNIMAFAVDGATRMQALIRDLLAYAQVSSQTPVLEPDAAHRGR